MADEKKKDPNKLVDKHTKMNIDDIIAKIDSWHSDTTEALDRKDRIMTDQKNGLKSLQDIEEKYFFQIRGEHATRKGKPKSYSLSAKDTKDQATELIYRMALDTIKKEMGDKAHDVYEGDTSMLKSYLAGKGVDFYKLRNDMIQKRTNLDKSEAYGEFKESLVGATIDDLVEQRHITSELMTDLGHKEKFVKHVRDKLSKSGYKLAESVEANQALSIYRDYLPAGKLTEENLSQYMSHVSKEKKKK